MNHQFIEARELIGKARKALTPRRQSLGSAVGRTSHAPHARYGGCWLVLAASDPNSQDALAYAQKALEINPQSSRAHRARGVGVRPVETGRGFCKNRTQPRIVPNRVEVVSSLPNKHAYQTAIAMPALQPQGRNWLLPALLICWFDGGWTFCIICIDQPVVGIHCEQSQSLLCPHRKSFGRQLRSPSLGRLPVDVSAFLPSNADNGSSTSDMPQSNPQLDAAPTATDVPTATQTPTALPTEEPLSTEVTAATETPGSMVMEIVTDTPTSESVCTGPIRPGVCQWKRRALDRCGPHQSKCVCL